LEQPDFPTEETHEQSSPEFHRDQPRRPERCVPPARARRFNPNVIDRVCFPRFRSPCFSALEERVQSVDRSHTVWEHNVPCAVSDGASKISPITWESLHPSTFCANNAFHCSAEVPVVPRPEDDRQIKSERDPTDGGFRVDVESTGHGCLEPCRLTSLPDGEELSVPLETRTV
jgi:hypothetical protein